MDTNSFDTIAESYYSTTPPIPESYVLLLKDIFSVKNDSYILDLGCGSGNLSLSFSQNSAYVEGLDSSKKMIEMAKEKDINNNVTWIHTPVEDFDFKRKKYDLIFSYESFHLFPNKTEIIKKCSSSLKKGGKFGIGWAMYAFDYPMKDSIEEIFDKYGVPWNNWGEWTCPDFPQLVEESASGLTHITEKKIKVKTQISTQKIKEYFFSVSKTVSLENSIKEKISAELEQRISEIYPSGECTGYDEYSVMFCIKE